MSDAAPASPAKKVAKKAAPKKPASHPPTLVMVKAAITALGEKTGSSFAAIKKYIEANYKVDLVYMASHIKKCIVSGVEKGIFVRHGNKGVGATGSFRLSQEGKKEKKEVKKPAKKPAAKKPAAKKAAKPKKAATKSPKKKAAAKPAKKAKSPKKAAAKPKKAKTPAKKPAAKKATKPKAKKPAKK